MYTWAEVKTRAFWGGFFVLFVTSLGLFGGSFDTVSTTQIALAFDGNVQHLETSKVYYEGRYLIGLGKRFIKFPRTLQTIKYGRSFKDPDGDDIECRASDGFPIRVQMAFQYQFAPANKAAPAAGPLAWNAQDLARLYLDFGNKHHDVYKLEFLEVVRDVCSTFSTIEFRELRADFTAAVKTELDKALSRIYGFVVKVELVSLDFDKQYADAIEDTQVAQQDIQQANSEQQVAIVQADSLIRVSTTTANITVLQAEAQAQAYLAQVQADADALLYRIEKQVEAFQDLRTRLGLNSTEQLLAYQYLTMLQEQQAADVTVAVDYPVLITV